MDGYWAHDLRGRCYHNTGIAEVIDIIDQGCGRVLDIGCGDGANLLLMKDRGLWAVGITVSDTEAQSARRNGHNVLICDALHTAFDRGAFDCVLLSHVFEHC